MELGKKRAMQMATTFGPIQNEIIFERQFSVQTIAELWGWSPDTVRSQFEDEPGVVKIGDRQSSRKRRYVTLRIPESVAARVYRRLAGN
jgi:hypothetical protein